MSSHLDPSGLAPLIAADEAPPVEVISGSAESPFFITCDHAGKALPRSLGRLGLSERELETHVAWDIGAAGVTRQLAARLGAFAILQNYSRLVIDCNRPLDVESSIATRSERTQIPGNLGLSRDDAARRAAAVFRPYHERISSELEARERQGQPTVLIALHSFTPVFLDVARPWHVGILYQRDRRLAARLLELLGRERGLVVGDNEPYAVSDLSDYGVVQYGERRGLPHVELEIRQDLIVEAAGQAEWAERIAGWLGAAWAAVQHGENQPGA